MPIQLGFSRKLPCHQEISWVTIPLTASTITRYLTRLQRNINALQVLLKTTMPPGFNRWVIRHAGWILLNKSEYPDCKHSIQRCCASWHFRKYKYIVEIKFSCCVWNHPIWLLSTNLSRIDRQKTTECLLPAGGRGKRFHFHVVTMENFLALLRSNK